MYLALLTAPEVVAVAKVEMSSILGSSAHGYTSEPAGQHGLLRGYLPATAMPAIHSDSNGGSGSGASGEGGERHLTSGSWMEFAQFMSIMTGAHRERSEVERKLVMRSEVESEHEPLQDRDQSGMFLSTHDQLSHINKEGDGDGEGAVSVSTGGDNGEGGKASIEDLNSLWLVFIRPALFRRVVDSIPKEYFVLIITFAVSVGVHFGVGMLFVFHAYLGKSRSLMTFCNIVHPFSFPVALYCILLSCNDYCCDVCCLAVVTGQTTLEFYGAMNRRAPPPLAHHSQLQVAAGPGPSPPLGGSPIPSPHRSVTDHSIHTHSIACLCLYVKMYVDRHITHSTSHQPNIYHKHH
jgi:hypothetical protein